MGNLFRDPRPLIEVSPINDIYADDIGALDPLGRNFRTIFFTWSWPLGGGPLERIVVAKIVRPRMSILRGENGAMAEWLKRIEHERPADLEKLQS